MASKFQQRHYVAVAQLIKNRLDTINSSTDKSVTSVRSIEIDAIAKDFDKMFRLDNYKYKSDTFFKACGISS